MSRSWEDEPVTDLHLEDDEPEGLLPNGRWQRVLIVVACVLAILLGLTAQWWNPYTRHQDREVNCLTAGACVNGEPGQDLHSPR